MRIGNFDSPEELILGGVRINSFLSNSLADFLPNAHNSFLNNQITFLVKV